MMHKAKEVLSPADYSNYRNIRAASAMFILVGGMFAIAGLVCAFDEMPPEPDDPPKAVMAVLGCVGVTGVIGDIAALRGNRRWAYLTYVMAAIYIVGVPIGTILSIIMFNGLGRYLHSMEEFEAGKSRPSGM